MRQPNRWGSSALRIGGWVGLSLAVAAALAAVVQRLGTRTPGGRPNVLLITIDTLRADRLGCYGAATRTPNVDRLAREGTLFENAACPVPATRPSHLSIFTSRYPREIGVVDNALAMPSGLVTLPEVFKSNGYRTAGFVGVSLLNPQSGAARGFDTFDFPHPQQQRNAEVVVPQALEWLRTATERPFFLWVHLFDPHMPYAPPPQYAPAAPIDWVRELPQVTWQRLLALADRHGGDLPSAALSRALSLYSGEVEKTDYWVGVLLDTLRARGVLDQTVVALTADHGECFEHGIFFEHYGCLYEGAAHVPLIVRYAAKVAAGERRRGIAEHVDLAPTLLALAGLPVPEAFVGRPLFNQHGTGKQYAVVQHPTYPQDAVALRRGPPTTKRNWRG